MKARPFSPSMVPISVSTDSYKQTHFQMYPEASLMAGYVEARRPYLKGDDHRMVSYGARYFVERWLLRQWTMDDVEAAEAMYATFNAGNTPHPFPKDLFVKFVQENDGWFPLKVQALRDGTVCYARTPQMVFVSEGDYARLVTWMETVGLQTVWYMSTVATLSRLIVSSIRDAFDKSVDEDAWWKLRSRFHDFGFRGTTSTEQSIMGGSAHLLSSDGSDTCSAAWYAQFHLNEGRPVGSSIPATEHSVMTSWDQEIDGVEHVIDLYGKGVFATVADSYSYSNYIWHIVPELVDKVRELGGFWVVRPDSGDPTECVVDGLKALEAAFGTTTNSKGYKVIAEAGIIQGDGIDRDDVTKILDAVMEAGFSAECVAFGMGSGLLQRLNRDSMGYAMKLSRVVDVDGTIRERMKCPENDDAKASLPGLFHVQRDWFDGEQGVHPPRAYPLEDVESGNATGENLLELIYDHGPVDYEWDSFDEMRARLEEEWNALPKQLEGWPWSQSLVEKRTKLMREIRAGFRKG